MNFRRRANNPPFEVMRPRPPASHTPTPTQATEHKPSRESNPDRTQPLTHPETIGPRAWDTFVQSASVPVTWRLPRGYVVLAGVMLLVVIVLAFYVGKSRGYKQREAERVASQQVEPTPFKGPLPEGFPGTGGGVGATDGSVGSDPGLPVVIDDATDPRQKGLNYFVLAHYDKRLAERAVAYLRSHGLDAAAKKVNNGLFQVLALRGFTATELKQPARREYEQKIKELGTVWKSQEKGPSDFYDAYPDKYDPKN
ncbi:MAG: hypothetical protein GC164_13700 [Phycisphaera sp.]|nr:hypothetical protein [Phycisphaera sp.]